ncbi:hypothetical protein ABID13_003680 [Enterocloster citroniae]|uniref:Uncharacterized protein n=1 Tax=Enterocloster citroniae TaxID=358743 RepID=A0ABV2G163_9FIRM
MDLIDNGLPAGMPFIIEKCYYKGMLIKGPKGPAADD